MVKTTSLRWEFIASLLFLAGVLHKCGQQMPNVPYNSARSCKSIGNTLIFSIVLFVIILIADANLSSAQASVEDAGTGDSVSDYDQSTSLFNLTVYSTPNTGLKLPVNPDDIFIPTTVWSLDTSTDHLYSIPSEASTFLGILENDAMFVDHWTQWVGGLWIDSQKAFGNTLFRSLLLGEASFSSMKTTVASCSGSSAEPSNLASCEINSNYRKKSGGYTGTFENNGRGNTIAPDDGATTGSNSASALSQESPSSAESGISSAVPAPAAQAFRHHWRDVLSTPPMDDQITSADDPTLPMDESIPSVDDPIAPIIDDETQVPSPVISIGTPWKDSNPLPIFIPSPESAIPETSTWIMLMIGFGTMFLVVHKNRRSSTKNPLVKNMSNIN